MKLSSRAENILSQTNSTTKMGDLRKIAKDIKKDHDVALELWSTEQFLPRLLATLIMDNKLLSQSVIDQLSTDMLDHSFEERNQLIDWLMANQLAKSQNTVVLMESWKK